MIELAAALTAPIAKLLLKSWLGDTESDIGANLYALALTRLGSAKARKAQRLVEDLTDAVVRDLERFFATERVTGLEPAASQLGETIHHHVDPAFLVHQRLDADGIRKGLYAARPPETIFPDEPERGAYRRLVAALAPRLRALAPELPGYELERDAALLRMAAVVDEVDQRLAAIAPVIKETAEGVRTLVDRPRQIAEGFERNYLDAVVRELDYVEILGIEDLDSKSRRASLSVAYLALNTRFGDGDEQQRIDFATVLTLLPLFGNRLWIDGGAGSGKSTLARWAALQAALWRLGRSNSREILEIAPKLDAWLDFFRPPERPKKDPRPPAGADKDDPLLHPYRREHPDKAALRTSSWRGRLPFIVYLRHATEGLQLESFPGALRTIAKAPDGWLDDAFKDDGAQALLIFDGVDEVPAGNRRDDILAQIDSFASRFPRAQIVVTSRPGAADRDVIADFQRVELDDLSEPQQHAFVDHWHRALTANFKRDAGDEAIGHLRTACLRELARQPALALLATTPLLCAGVCALHWLQRRDAVEEAWAGRVEAATDMQGDALPSGLWNLCEALTRMLVHQRDMARGMAGRAPDLDYSDKREILARIAYAMVAGDLLSAMSREEVTRHVSAALARFAKPVERSADDILDALLARSGVLRGSGEDAVEFVHNTVKAFLAAKYYLGLDTPDDLVRRIAAGSPKELASGLDEVAVFAAASPDHPAYAERLIDALLSEGMLERLSRVLSSTEDRRRFQILAVRCEAAATNLESTTRARVRALAPSLFPPSDNIEARRLTALRDDAVPYLQFDPHADPTISAASAHCLRLIGTDAARVSMLEYRATGSLTVAEELIHEVHPLEIRSVVESAQDIGVWWGVPPTIKAAIHDLRPLADLRDLQTLCLFGTEVDDVETLRGLANLRLLYLFGTQVDDIEPLKGMANLQYLDLRDTQVSDIEPLKGLDNLRYLDLRNTQVAEEDVDVLWQALTERGNTSVGIRGP